MIPTNEAEWLRDRQGYIDADEDGRKIVEVVEQWLTAVEEKVGDPGELRQEDLHKALEECFPFLETREFNIAMMMEVLALAANHWKWSEAMARTWSGWEKMTYHALCQEKIAVFAEIAAKGGDQDE